MRVLALIAVLFAVGCAPAPSPGEHTPAITTTPSSPCLSIACEPHGIAVDDRGESGGPPAVTAIDDGLVFAWTDVSEGSMVLVTVQSTGQVTTKKVSESAGLFPGGWSIASAGGTVALVAENAGAIELLEVNRSSQLFPGSLPSIAASDGAFLVAADDGSNIELARVGANGDVALETDTPISGFNPHVVPLADKLLVAAVDSGAPFMFAADPSSLAPTTAPIALPTSSPIADGEDTTPSVLVTSAGVLIAVALGTNLLAANFDPTTSTFTSAPNVVAEGVQFDRVPSMAQASDGTIAVCFATSSGATPSAAGISLQRIDVAGNPIGAPDVVAEGEKCTGGCAVGALGPNLFVLWWRCGGDAAENQMILEERLMTPTTTRPRISP